MIRRAAYLGLAMALLLVSAPASAADRVIHIGYQKYGTLVFEKARGTLEKRLAPMHVRVVWTEFLGGPALLEAMGAESIDFGATGDTPPIFAQAAGVPLVYVGVEPATPHGEAVIVPQNSPIHNIADLRGKKIALNRGSNVHNLLVRVLAAGGLTPNDVQSMYLKPTDARPAFENGSVDAWAIWDPYYAAAQTAMPTRIISDGVAPSGKTIDENHQFFVASRDFAEKNGDILKAVLSDLAQTEAYGTAHQEAVVKLLAPEMGMDEATVRLAVGRLAFGVQPIDDRIMASQQDIADTLFGLHLLPAKLDLKDATLPKRS